MKPLGFLTGMAVEAACIDRAARAKGHSVGQRIHVTGGNAHSAILGARRLISLGAKGLVSFGLSGGLDPVLKPGDLVCGTFVWHEGSTIRLPENAWEQRPATISGIGSIVSGGVAGVASPVLASSDKAALLARSGAVAVDMESHAVAVAANEAGLPAIVVRAIADPASRPVPTAALAGLGPDGRRRPLAVLGQLLTHPSEIPAILSLARDSRAALRSLSAVASIFFNGTLRTD